MHFRTNIFLHFFFIFFIYFFNLRNISTEENFGKNRSWCPVYIVAINWESWKMWLTNKNTKFVVYFLQPVIFKIAKNSFALSENQFASGEQNDIILQPLLARNSSHDGDILQSFGRSGKNVINYTLGSFGQSFNIRNQLSYA